MKRSNIAVAALCSVLLAGGCSGEKPASAAQPRERKEGDVAPRAAVVVAPTQPYRTVAVAGAGRIAGTVEFDGTFPADTVIQLTPEQSGCGESVVDHRVDRSGNRVAGVAVWLTDIRQGKALPAERRFELQNQDCVLDPRVQLVVTGGTLNVISADVAMHRNRIIDVATGESRALAPFNDDGQVIPFDRLLTKPAELEVTCELHPWTKAYVLVLDHPYFATTGKAGDFTIDNVPAGTYHLRAWHPILGLVDQTVNVGAGGTATVAMKLPGEIGASPMPASTSDSGRVPPPDTSRR
jgi:Polysaccharide lyase family 4, domain II